MTERSAPAWWDHTYKLRVTYGADGRELRMVPFDIRPVTTRRDKNTARKLVRHMNEVGATATDPACIAAAFNARAEAIDSPLRLSPERIAWWRPRDPQEAMARYQWSLS